MSKYQNNAQHFEPDAFPVYDPDYNQNMLSIPDYLWESPYRAPHHGPRILSNVPGLGQDGFWDDAPVQQGGRR